MDLAQLPDTACEILLLQLSLSELAQTHSMFPNLALYREKYFLHKYCALQGLPKLSTIEKVLACAHRTTRELQLVAIKNNDRDYLLQAKEIPDCFVLAKALMTFGTDFIMRRSLRGLLEPL